MTEKSGREGFVGWMGRSGPKDVAHGEYRNLFIDAKAATDSWLTPVYVTPLVEGEPVPGETWVWAGEPMEIVGLPIPRDGRASIVPVRTTAGGYFLPPADCLTRAPETREVMLQFADKTRYECLRVPASMSDDDLMAAIRGAVEVTP